MNIFQLIVNNPTIMITQISKETGLTNHTIELGLAKLKDMQKIDRIDGRRNGYWEVKL